MLTFTLCGIIVFLLASLFIQRANFLKRFPGVEKKNMPTKKKSEQVSYLEPSITNVSSVSVKPDGNVLIDDLDLSENDSIVPEDAETDDTVSVEVADDAPAAEERGNVELDYQDSGSFISLYIESQEDRSYIGYELLQAILSSGLRYGKQSIFHYYADKMAQDGVLFSLASAIAPGTFDLPHMGSFSTRALIVMMDTSKVADPLKVFEKMLNVAGQLCEDLGGRVLNSDRELLTKEYVREICMQINSRQKGKLNMDLFEQVDALV